MQGLEVPGGDSAPDWDSLYLYRGDEVNIHRPVFTGDVFAHGEGLLIIVQHPCAIRLDGVNLAEKLLVCPVTPSQFVDANRWANGNYKQMPLPRLVNSGSHHSAYFHRPDVVPSSEVVREKRIACLSSVGVNLLLQRWLHHNSRVIVPTSDIHHATVEQLEEADLIEEWCDETVSAQTSIAQAEAQAHEWLRSDSGNGTRWQNLLEDPQTRSRVRSGMRAALRDRN